MKESECIHVEGIPKEDHHPIPLWLKISYVVLVGWGITWFFLSWYGAPEFLDTGSWKALEKAAKTVE